MSVFNFPDPKMISLTAVLPFGNETSEIKPSSQRKEHMNVVSRKYPQSLCVTRRVQYESALLKGKYILTTDCGRRPPLPRVIGGDEAIPHSWPWQARIILQDKDGKWNHKCGASLIHPEWIVTAAHCLAFHPDPRIYGVILGLS